MGWDRRVLPRDRDRDETYPWMGLLAIVAIVFGLLLIVWLIFGVLGAAAPTESFHTILSD